MKFFVRRISSCEARERERSRTYLLVLYSLLKHTILLEPYICFLLALRSSPSVSEVGFACAINIRLPNINSCVCFPTFTVGIPTTLCVGTYQTELTQFHLFLVLLFILNSATEFNTNLYSVFKVLPKTFIKEFSACPDEALAKSGASTQRGRLRSVSGTSASQSKERWSREYIGGAIWRQASVRDEYIGNSLAALE